MGINNNSPLGIDIHKLLMCAVLSCSVVSNSWQPCQAPLSMGLSSQEYWSGLPFPCGVCVHICIYMCVYTHVYICVCKASVYNAEDPSSSPGLGESPGEGNGNPLQYYCLENPMDRGAW